MVRNKRGITMVALIVTIIVLLILAGVAIMGIIGDDSVINKAKRSADETKYKIAEEEVKEEYYGLLLEDEYFMDYSLETQLELLVNS